jgi:1-deoxy-D-xylulose-5-phosphate reductoisomerase
MPAQNLTILGSTGSIGVNTLDVASRHPDRFTIYALTAHENVSALFEQCRMYRPRYAVLSQPQAAEALHAFIRQHKLGTQVLNGASGLVQVAQDSATDTVMAAIVGAAGLAPVLAAARSGKRLLLANKEVLVMAGQVFMDEVIKNQATLIPIDSEHNAVFQVMPQAFREGLDKAGVSRILLTASGGPFLHTDLDALDKVTPEQAIAHPNWVMGKKISVDSATMMNKGLEVVEACWLFGAKLDQIQVIIHPQSVVHSMVEYVDGSVLAQLGEPDMRTPIAYGLGYPQRIEAGVKSLNLANLSGLNFYEPDLDRFPCLALAYQALRQGGAAPAILNAANEVAVEAFLARKITFTAIPRVIETTLTKADTAHFQNLEDILKADKQARIIAKEALSRLGDPAVVNE